MPTPSNNESTISLHPSCPPELDDDRSSWRNMDGIREAEVITAPEVHQQPTPPPSDSQVVGVTETHMDEQSKRMNIDEEAAASNMLSPMSTVGDKQDESDLPALTSTHLSSPSMGYDFSNVRLIPTSPSSFLRAGSRFHGTQQSERQVYDVQVEIKHVDMRESFLCGYLRIQGLTEDHPTLTTYFEGEIIGPKYTFYTKHQDWGSSNNVDLQHWQKFQAFRPLQKLAKRGIPMPGLATQDNIFMRWKEHFLVPDHRVRTITGASFEGFYYICFNQIKGSVSGIYFHAKSEKFQQLELEHVQDKGCFAAVEFR
ncbi:vacuolar import and degradation protein-domain-containing protein [Bisporella sp. PMI_857]|nr:vacuolar import and degradation protein-domain-containing protein [Bisporella sp. PMI_857]